MLVLGMTNLELVSGKCYPKNLLDHICCWLQGPSGEAVSSEWIVKLELNSVMIGYGLNGMLARKFKMLEYASG